MGTIKKLETTLNAISVKTRAVLHTYHEYVNVYKKRGLIKSVNLTSEQVAEIDRFFKEHYGRKIPKYWHRLYQSYTGEFRRDYFPEILLSTKLEQILNPYRIAEVFGDKNLLPLLFSGHERLRVPKTLASCVRGRIRDANHTIIDSDAFFRSIGNAGLCVIKKTTDTSSGQDVQLCDLRGGIDVKTGKGVKEIINTFGNDFVVQELINQHESIAKLNPTSVNTFRIITYICDGQVQVCPIALRLGRASADRDNIHYGGICVGVDEDGNLRNRAYSEYGESFDRHPDTQVVFYGYVVGGGKLKSVIQEVKNAHGRMAQLGMLSWDIALDEEANGVIIEINTTGQSAWFCQMVNGEPLFGSNTGRMLELLSKKKRSKCK